MPCLYCPPLFCGTDGLWVCPSVFFCPAPASVQLLPFTPPYNVSSKDAASSSGQTQELLCLSLGALVIFDGTSRTLLRKILFSLGFPSLASCFLPLLQHVHWDVFVICLFQRSMKARPGSLLSSLLHYSPSVSGKPYLDVQGLHFSGTSSFSTPATCFFASSFAVPLNHPASQADR